MTLTKESTTIQERVLNLQDRCDSCNSQAFVSVKLITGELLFCGHHYNKNKDKLNSQSYEIVDERHYINYKSESSN